MQSGFVSDLQSMLAQMEPVLAHEPYRFLGLPGEDADAGWVENPFAMIREDEGVTYIVPADMAGMVEGGEDHFARITLQVKSALEGVGLTAAVATGLASEGIACNVIAAFNHDHLFVPWPRREDALTILSKLSDDARR